jgi:hypothetical protein
MLLVAICRHDSNLSFSLLSGVGQATCVQRFGNCSAGTWVAARLPFKERGCHLVILYRENVHGHEEDVQIALT